MKRLARNPITIAMGALVWVLIAVAPSVAAQSPQTPIAGASIPQFIQPLPTLTVSPVGGTIQTFFGNTALDIRMCEFQAKMLPPGTFAPGVQPLTWVWGYLVDLGVGTIPDNGATRCEDLVDYYDDYVDNDSFGPLDTPIGPVLVSERGLVSTNITYINDLGSASSTQVLAYKYATDQTLHWADPLGLDCMGSLMGGIPPFNSTCAQNYSGSIPAVAHLHGGEVPAEVDGSPDSWFTSDGTKKGSRYYTFPGVALPGNQALYKYPNLQEAAPLWFHDHTLGATRLNVFAGMAGAYFIYDPLLQLPENLHPLTEVIPIVLQDRMFDTTGQLFYQTDSAGGVLWVTNPEHPYWTPEFVGDTIMVNGKVWPFLDVEPKRYRFLFLNGSNARTYEMFFTNPVTKVDGPPLWVIGTDGGYLDTPQKVDPALKQKLVMQPGERYEVIVDFAGQSGNSLVLRNTGKTPYPAGATPQGSTLGRLLKINVNLPLGGTDTSYDPASGTPLRRDLGGGDDQRIVRFVNPATGTLANGVTAAVTRQLTLNEVMGMPVTTTDPVTGATTAYPGGPLEILVNNTKWSGTFMGTTRSDFTPATANGVTTWLSEIPREGDTEVWEIVNLTADAHPIHLHLVQFQLLNRQMYNTRRYPAVYDAAFPDLSSIDPMCTGGVFCPAYGPPLDYNTPNASGAVGGNPDVTPYLQGPVRPPLPWEAGWKDTVITFPGQVTRIAVRFAPTDLPVGTAAADLHYPFDPTGYDADSDMPYFYNYVWHCHIIDHEDNEMMRPDAVDLNPSAPLPSARTLVKGSEY